MKNENKCCDDMHTNFSPLIFFFTVLQEEPRRPVRRGSKSSKTKAPAPAPPKTRDQSSQFNHIMRQHQVPEIKIEPPSASQPRTQDVGIQVDPFEEEDLLCLSIPQEERVLLPVATLGVPRRDERRASAESFVTVAEEMPREGERVVYATWV